MKQTQKKMKMKRGDSPMKDGEERIINLVHVVKRNFRCKGVPSLVIYFGISWKHLLREHFGIAP
jgi:hypothetical protein